MTNLTDEPSFNLRFKLYWQSQHRHQAGDTLHSHKKPPTLAPRPECSPPRRTKQDTLPGTCGAAASNTLGDQSLLLGPSLSTVLSMFRVHN